MLLGQEALNIEYNNMFADELLISDYTYRKPCSVLSYIIKTHLELTI